MILGVEKVVYKRNEVFLTAYDPTAGTPAIVSHEINRSPYRVAAISEVIFQLLDIALFSQ